MTTEFTEPEHSGDTGDRPDDMIENPFKRAFTVIVSPRRTFESLAAKSGRLDWIVPIVLTLLVSLLMINTGYDYIRSEQAATSIERIRNMNSLTDEQKDTQIANIRDNLNQYETVGLVVGNISTVISMFVSIAVIALILKGIARFWLGSPLTFSNGFKIAALSSMISAAGTLVELPFMHILESFSRSRLTLALLLPSGMADSFLYQVMSIDLFTILYAVFLGIGLAVFTRTSLAKALTPLILLWVFFQVVAVTVSGMVSGIGA